MEKKFYVGTSGWMYKDWAKKFYPKEVKSAHLSFYSKQLYSVEINSTFYRMPPKKNFLKWKEEAIPDFIFSVKINQYLTHRKRLILDEESMDYLREFLVRVKTLREKLGALLIQMPPSAKVNLPRLDNFLRTVRKKFKQDVAVEFRHPTWFSNECYQILEKHNAALVFADSGAYKLEKIFTADFAYLRFHGPGTLFASRYREKDLQKWKKFLVGFPAGIRRVYVYFNNDYESYAIENALYLQKILEKCVQKNQG